MVVLWLYAGCRIAANRAKAARKRRCGAHKTLRFANLLQARRAAVPIGGEKPARLSAVRPLRPAQTLFRQKAAFLFMDKPARKSAKRTAFAKGQVGRGEAGTPPSRVCADRRRTERRAFAAGGAQDPRSLSYPFYAKSPLGPSYPSRAILCAIKKDAGRTARRRPRRTESRRQKRAEPKRPPVGERFGGTHTPDGGNRRVGRVFPRAAPARAAPIGRAAGPRVGQEKRTFSAPLATCQRRHILQTPARARFLPAFCERRSAKETKPAPAASEAGSAPPKRARGEDPRRRASRRAGVENLRRYLRLAGGPLVLQQLQRTFFVLVFLYFDYACTQSPAHCAAEKTGRTIFS